jgi:pilus assembly protein CpaF
MALRERLISEKIGVPGAPGSGESAQYSFQEMKAKLHRSLINRMDLTKLSALTTEQAHAEVSRLAESVLAQESLPLSAADRERLVNDVRHELFGLGPLEPLLADPTISDILVNAHGKIYIERRGKLEVTNVAFKDDEHLMRVIERIVTSVGRRIDEDVGDGWVCEKRFERSQSK